jgi:hypothetical protein
MGMASKPPFLLGMAIVDNYSKPPGRNPDGFLLSYLFQMEMGITELIP